MAASSATKAVCLSPRVLDPCAIAAPLPVSSAVTIHPSPANLRQEPSVQAWHVRVGVFEVTHGVARRGQGAPLYRLAFLDQPSVIRRGRERF
jgi:hypothetical protein